MSSGCFPSERVPYVYPAVGPRLRQRLTVCQVVDAMQEWGECSTLKSSFFEPSAFRRSRGPQPSPCINLERVLDMLGGAATRLQAYQKQHKSKVISSEIFVKVLALLQRGMPSPLTAHTMLSDMNSFTPHELVLAGTDAASASWLLAMSYNEILGIVVDLANPDYSCLREVCKARAVRRLHDRLVAMSMDDGRASQEALSLSRISNSLAEELLTHGTMGVFVEPPVAPPQSSFYVVRWADEATTPST